MKENVMPVVLELDNPFRQEKKSEIKVSRSVVSLGQKRKSLSRNRESASTAKKQQSYQTDARQCFSVRTLDGNNEA